LPRASSSERWWCAWPPTPENHWPKVVSWPIHNGPQPVYAFDVSAVDYLLKPFDDERFTAMWQRIGERRAMRAVVQETEKFAELLAQLRGSGVWRPATAVKCS